MAKAETRTTDKLAPSEWLYNLQIEGLTPLLHHNIAGKSQRDAVVDKGDDESAFERDHVEWSLYTGIGGVPVLPARSLHKAFIDGCKFMTITPPAPMRTWTALVTAAMLVIDDLALGDWKAWATEVHVGRGKVTRWRPRFDRWNGSVGIVVFDERLSLPVLEDLAYRVGRYVGVADGRRIGFGRCRITVTRA